MNRKEVSSESTGSTAWGIAIIVGSVFFLSSCNLQERFAEACASYGFEKGTRDYAYCMQNEAQAFRDGMSALSATLQQQEQARAQAAYQQQYLNALRNSTVTVNRGYGW